MRCAAFPKSDALVKLECFGVPGLDMQFEAGCPKLTRANLGRMEHGPPDTASTDGIVQYAPSQTWFLLYLKSMTAGWQVSFTFTSLD